MTDHLKVAKEALDMYRTPLPEDTWEYTTTYAKISALISIAESLKSLVDEKMGDLKQ